MIRSDIPLFFQQKQIERGETPSTFRYDLPSRIRQQILDLWEEVEYPGAQNICKTLRFQLDTQRLIYIGRYPFDVYPYHYEVEKYFLKEKDSEKALTVIDMICQAMFNEHKKIIRQINRILREERVGYEFSLDANMLVALEDDNFFRECTQPCLSILGQRKYYKTLQHYVAAYEKLAAGEETLALLEIGRAIKTMIGTRLKELKIAHHPKARFTQLLDVVQKHLVYPEHSVGYINMMIREIARTRSQLQQQNRMSYPAYLNGNAKAFHGNGKAVNGNGKSNKGNTAHRDDPYIRFLMNQASTTLLFLAQIELTPAGKH